MYQEGRRGCFHFLYWVGVPRWIAGFKVDVMHASRASLVGARQICVGSGGLGGGEGHGGRQPIAVCVAGHGPLELKFDRLC